MLLSGAGGPAVDLSTTDKQKAQIQAIWAGFYNTWQPSAAIIIQVKIWLIC